MPPRPDRTAPTAAEALTVALARSVARVLEHEAGVRRGDDAEAVHQARVGTRRLRSDLASFDALLDRDRARELRRAVRPLASRLGTVRDAEVLLARLRQRVQELPEKDRVTAGHLLRRLEFQRSRERVELLTFLDGAEYRALVEQLRRAASRPALAPASRAPARDALLPPVRRRWKRLAGAVAGLGPTPAASELHRVRILAKRCRYAAEALIPVFGTASRDFARALARAQDVLGEHQDATVMQGWLRDAGGDAPPDEAFVAGALAAREERAAEEARARWPDAWKRASARKLRRWL